MVHNQRGAPPPYGHIVRPRVRGGVRLTIPPRLNLPPGHASGMTAVRACVPRAGEGILAPYLRVGVASGYDPGAALTFPFGRYSGKRLWCRGRNLGSAALLDMRNCCHPLEP